MSKVKKVIIIVLAIIISLETCFIIRGFFARHRNQWEYVYCGQNLRVNAINELQLSNISTTLKNNEIRAILRQELNFNMFIYIERSLPNGTLGTTNFNYNIIYIDKSQCSDIYEYCFALAHEICHLKYYSTNEMSTQYFAITNLIKNDNEFLNYCGKVEAIKVLSGQRGRSYDCSYYLINGGLDE